MGEHDYRYNKHKFMTEFILLYKSMPCLWRTKSKEYHMRDLRSKSYKSLILKLREIDPIADRDSVVKKINSLRSNLRKEKHKVAEQAKQGVVYKPKLWYFTLFDFLDNQGRARVVSKDSEDENTEMVNIKQEEGENEYEREDNDPLLAFEHSHEDELSENSSPSPPPKNIISRTESERVAQSRSKRTLEETFPHPVDQQISTTSLCSINKITKLEGSSNYGDSICEDQFDIFGRNVATKLRNIASTDNKQRLMAEKIINDALFLAEMGEITLAKCNRLLQDK